MIRFVFRFFGLWILAAAFIFLIYDGTVSIGANALTTVSFGNFWNSVGAGSQAEVQRLIERHLPAEVWDPGMLHVLNSPTWLVLGVVGMILVLLGRKKKPLIGFARR